MRLLTLLRLDRSTWLTLHLYLALSVGLFFAILGFSGSVSIYREEIDRLLNPDLVVAQATGPLLSLDKIMLALRIEHPKRYGSWTLEMPQSPDGMITAWFDKPHETIDQRYAPLMVSINPYTGAVVANRFWGETFTTWILNLHTQLGLEDMGWNIVGGLGVLLLFSVLSGVYLWWPGWNKLSSVFRLHYQAGLQHLALDCHRWLGLISAAGLLLLALTGSLLSYPALMTKLFGAAGMNHGETGRDIVSTAEPTKNPTSLAGAAFIARAPFPHAELRRVTTPAGDTGVYRINLRQSEEINRRHPYTTVWVDRWSGHIKEVRDPLGFSLGERMSTWIWPLHTGEALGPKGRLFWFVCGQSLFWLYVTGLLRWLCRKGWVRNVALPKIDLQQRLRVLQPVGAQAYRWAQQQTQRHGPGVERWLRVWVGRSKQWLQANWLRVQAWAKK